MYMHLGEDILVRQNEIVAVIDIKTAMGDGANRAFLNNAEKNGKIHRIIEKREEKSLVITVDKCYLSPISPPTLEKGRAGVKKRNPISRSKKK